jgi:hypothetical protein
MSLVHNASSSGSPLAELSSGQLGIGGAEVEHVVRDGMPHGFYFFPGMFQQGDKLLRRSRHFSSAQVWLDTSPFALDFRGFERWTTPADGLHSRCVPTI